HLRHLVLPLRHRAAPWIGVVVQLEEHSGAIITGAVGWHHHDLAGFRPGLERLARAADPEPGAVHASVKRSHGLRVVIPAGDTHERADSRATRDRRERVLSAGANPHVPDAAFPHER